MLTMMALKCSVKDSVSDMGSNNQASTHQEDEQNKPPCLNLCSDALYDKGGEVHGVAYHSEEGNEGWTPVGGRCHRAKRTVPLHLVHCRAPPDVKATLESSSDAESNSDSSGASLSIPDHATVKLFNC